MKLNLYAIRLCRTDEYDKLIKFIREYWNANHIFCRNKKLFEFQHGDGSKGFYDFVIAVHNETGEIHAVLGYISSSRYDGGDLERPKFISGALWKVRDDVKNNEIGKLGLGVLFHIIKSFPDSIYLTLGLSVYSRQIYNALHFNFAIMNHYYIASKYISEFAIAADPIVNHDSVRSSKFSLGLLNIDSIPEKLFNPEFKNREYFRNRYINHPFYKYELLGIIDSSQDIIAAFVIREAYALDRSCIRIVDMISGSDSLEKLEGLEGSFHEFLHGRGAEFIDCYNYGIEKDIFIRAGFREVDGNTITPNYFEPFERRNVTMHCASLSKPGRNVIIFKGDGDQDRPNLIN